MKNRTVHLKQDNMLCHRCVINVVKTISQMPGIKEFNVDLDTKSIRIKYSDAHLSRQVFEEIINAAILENRAMSFEYSGL